ARLRTVAMAHAVGRARVVGRALASRSTGKPAVRLGDAVAAGCDRREREQSAEHQCNVITRYSVVKLNVVAGNAFPLVSWMALDSVTVMVVAAGSAVVGVKVYVCMFGPFCC